MPLSPEMPVEDDNQLPPLDLNRVTGKKTLFASSESDDDNDNDEKTKSELHVPVSLSISEPRTVPDQFNTSQTLSLPMPSNATSSATLDAIKTRVANLISTTTSNSSSTSGHLTAPTTLRLLLITTIRSTTTTTTTTMMMIVIYLRVNSILSL
jgi:hypothetical protein